MSSHVIVGMRRIALFLSLAATAGAQDAATLLAKAREAFIQNQARERHWTWVTATTRAVIDKKGSKLQDLPSFTVESPIRSDGKRCNAVIAWGDSVEPYLANAAADERCKVADENRDTVQIAELLDPRPAKIESRKAAITISFPQNKALVSSPDPSKRCAASITGRIQLDAASFFPKRIALEVPDHGCEGQRTVTEHYEDLSMQVHSGPTKDTTLLYEYELEHDRAGDQSKDYWIAAHVHIKRALLPRSTWIVNWSRRTQLTSPAANHFLDYDAKMTATELSAEAKIKFDVAK